MTDRLKALKIPALLALAATLAMAASPPAHAESAAGGVAMNMVVGQRLGQTVYCLTDGTPLDKACKTESAWRKRGVMVQLPAKEDGTVLATRTDPGKALARK